jgi:hypothetical protein
MFTGGYVIACPYALEPLEFVEGPMELPFDGSFVVEQPVKIAPLGHTTELLLDLQSELAVLLLFLQVLHRLRLCPDLFGAEVEVACQMASSVQPAFWRDSLTRAGDLSGTPDTVGNADPPLARPIVAIRSGTFSRNRASNLLDG